MADNIVTIDLKSMQEVFQNQRLRTQEAIHTAAQEVALEFALAVANQQPNAKKFVAGVCY